MDLQCRRCHKPIAADGINIQQMIAKCQHCNAVFTFNNAEAQSEAAANAATERKQRGAIPVPARWAMRHEGSALIFSNRWFRPVFIFLAVFCTVWDSFLFLWYSLAFGEGTVSASAFSVIFMVFPLLHVAVGLGLTYYTIAGFINTTTITVDRGRLIIRHFPLPWLYGGAIATNEIDQIYCKESVQTNKGTAWYRYAVSVLLKNGRERKLIANLDAPEEALYLEAEIEKFLGITDRAVAGEYKS